MDLPALVSLIDRLAKLVEAGPAKPQAPAPHFQAAWALIKRIGPSFREVHHKDPKVREANWSRFQKAVEKLKAEQVIWEDTSLKIKVDLLQRLEAAAPALTMAELAGATIAPADNTPLSAEEEEAQKLTPAARRMARLKQCSDDCNTVLSAFMAVKASLVPAHYKEISDTLRSVRQAVQKEWDSFKVKAREHTAKIADAKSKPKEEKPKAKTHSLKKLEHLLAEEQYLHEHKLSEIVTLRKAHAQATTPEQAARTLSWITASEQVVVQLESSIASLRELIAAAQNSTTS